MQPKVVIVKKWHLQRIPDSRDKEAAGAAEGRAEGREGVAVEARGPTTKAGMVTIKF